MDDIKFVVKGNNYYYKSKRRPPTTDYRLQMRTVKLLLKYILAIGFVLAGINHFVNTPFYQRMMPPYFPAHTFFIYLSGVLEIALGILLLVPKYTRHAAFGMIALLVAVYPANFYMAQNPELFSEFRPWMIRLRLPLQFIIIAWAHWYTRPDFNKDST